MRDAGLQKDQGNGFLDALGLKKKFGGFFSNFLNNVWFVFTVVYGCFYYIVNAHYKD